MHEPTGAAQGWQLNCRSCGDKRSLPFCGGCGSALGAAARGAPTEAQGSSGSFRGSIRAAAGSPGPQEQAAVAGLQVAALLEGTLFKEGQRFSRMKGRW